MDINYKNMSQEERQQLLERINKRLETLRSAYKKATGREMPEHPDYQEIYPARLAPGGPPEYTDEEIAEMMARLPPDSDVREEDLRQGRPNRISAGRKIIRMPLEKWREMNDLPEDS